MSLKNLPDVAFVETDAEKTISNIVTVYEGITGKSLAPADPERLFLMGLGTIIVQQRQLINHAGKMNLLAYSEGDFLDHLGAFTGTSRLGTAPAKSICRFSLSAPLSFVVAIDAGTRVSPDGKLFFQTEAYAQIDAGSTHVDVNVICMSPGTKGNDYLPGQINQLVDPISYVTSVSNTITSAGGADREEDASYRERIHDAPDRYSVAGPEAAYITLAKSAHQDIADVSVTSPSDATVQVTVLMKGGALPDEPTLQAVAGAVTPKDRRPLTDKVIVKPPVVHNFKIDLDYFINSDDSEVSAEVQTKVAQSVAGYKAWQVARLGRDINPDELIFRIRQAGAKRVVLRSPAYQKLERHQVARLEGNTVNYAGVEDE